MPMLDHEPLSAVGSLDELLGIAMAMEEEATRRYAQLATLMERRGEPDTAALFRALAAEEEGHVDMVEGWAGTLGVPPPSGAGFVWRLPPEIARSWDELTERTRLTPYRALALAVLNEQRAFAFYSYVAAHATDAAVRARAEDLAAEELRHAALLRRERRKAYRRDRAAGETAARADTPAELARLAATMLSGAAREHAGLAHRLHALNADAEATLLTAIAEEERRLAGPPLPSAPPPAPSLAPPQPATHATVDECLRAARSVLERVSEAFGDVAGQTADEAVLNDALRLREAAIGHLARLARRPNAPG